MHLSLTKVVSATLAVVLLIGCGESKHEYHRKDTIPVRGRILVNGDVPDSSITVRCHPEGGIDQKHPTITQALSGDNGEFELSTYESGDGVPPGEYKVTFFWGKFNTRSMSFVGPDRLKNRYNNPAKSDITLSVTDSEPIDMGVISLQTKK